MKICVFFSFSIKAHCFNDHQQNQIIFLVVLRKAIARLKLIITIYLQLLYQIISVFVQISHKTQIQWEQQQCANHGTELVDKLLFILFNWTKVGSGLKLVLVNYLQ